MFLRDRLMGTTKRVSVGTGGSQLNGDQLGAAMTPDARYVVFVSTAKSLLPKPQRLQWAENVFINDMVRGRTERVSVPQRRGQFCTTAGVFDVIEGKAWVSDTGRFVAFPAEDCNNRGYTSGAFIRDRRLRRTRELAKSHLNAAPLGASPSLRYIALGTEGGSSGTYHHLVIRDRKLSRNIRVEDALPQKNRNFSWTSAVFITHAAASIVFDDTKVAYRYVLSTKAATPVLDTSARHRFAQVVGASADARYVAVITNALTPSTSVNFLYRVDTESSDSPIIADVDNGGTPYDGRWVLGMGMSGDAHTIGFTVVDSGSQNGAYVRTNLP